MAFGVMCCTTFAGAHQYQITRHSAAAIAIILRHREFISDITYGGIFITNLEYAARGGDTSDRFIPVEKLACNKTKIPTLLHVAQSHLQTTQAVC